MKIHSTRLGEVQVEEGCIVTMPEGMLGFSGRKRYALVPHGGGGIFRWLQSLEDPSLAFLVVDPWTIKPDYDPVIPPSDARALGLEEDSLKVMYVVVTVPKGNPEGMTANLLGPLVINAETQEGRQVVVLNDTYTTDYPIIEGIRAWSDQAEGPSSTEGMAADRAA